MTSEGWSEATASAMSNISLPRFAHCSLPPRIDGPPRGSPPPRPSPVAAESPSGPPLMFSTKFRSAGIAVMAANGIDGKRGSR